MTPDRLARYRAKRAASRTPEPFGGQVLAGGSLFVVQKHAATRLHWDLRLEHEGVLMSWAVPKGPSPNQADKRLAVRTEDHPLEYAEFEGVIPKGEYGAGSMIVWDKGSWRPLEPVGQGLDKGKLLFQLRGHKLLGRWTLVKTRQSEDSWLLIKERDEHLRPEGSTDDYPDDSIFSGLTVEEFGRADRIAEALGEELASAGAEPRRVEAASCRPMLAFGEEAPFTRDGWFFEVKYDGYRLMAERRGGEPVLRSRSGQDVTRTFPEIARAVRGLPYEPLLLDGEIVVNGRDGYPSFSRLQRRGKVSNATDALSRSTRHPAVYHAFDLPAVEGFDLRSLPLSKRKTFLKKILPTVGPIRYVDHIEREGRAVYERAVARGLEGIVGKRARSAYVSGRSRAWVKFRSLRTSDFAVVGWTEPGGDRPGFGALHLASRETGDWVYRGSVGTGFSDRELTELGRLLRESSAPKTVCTEELPADSRKHRWVEPSLVVEVRYRQITDSGHLRLPVFARLRRDKLPEECRLEIETACERENLRPSEPNAVPGGRIVPFTNLNKVFWPDEGRTKGDLLAYHRSIAPWMLPYLRDRPVVMTRYPDGIEGKSFYQKDAPEYAPAWLRRLRVWSESSGRELSYFVADDLDSLLYLINLGTIPLHLWPSRADTLSNPDWCILDLDPKGAPFSDVVTIARAVRELADEMELPSFAKTSGSSGMHVLLPLPPGVTYDQSRMLGLLLARVVVEELPRIATLERGLDKRGGKVYVDYLQNRYGRLLAAPFTVRPLPGAPVSVPLRWEEVAPGLSIGDHTIATVPERMEALGEDPMAEALRLVPDLGAALDRLEELRAG